MLDFQKNGTVHVNVHKRPWSDEANLLAYDKCCESNGLIMKHGFMFVLFDC